MCKFINIVGIGSLLLVAVTPIAAVAAPAHKAFKGAELLPKATIKLDAARAVALKAHPGKVTDEELEAEAGGSGLRYSFDIASKGKTYEVGIDAKTGAVLEDKAEGKNPD